MSDLDSEFDVERLRKITDDMITAITDPAFVEAMRTLRKAPFEKRLKYGAELLNPEKLRAQGVPLPKDMRITSRYFEPGQPGVIEITDIPGVDPRKATSIGLFDNLGPLSAGGCACAGGLTFCGGAGGSTN